MSSITIHYVDANNTYPDEEPDFLTFRQVMFAGDHEVLADALEEAIHAEGGQTRRTTVTQTSATEPVPGGSKTKTKTITVKTDWRTSLPAPEE